MLSTRGVADEAAALAANHDASLKALAPDPARAATAGLGLATK